ncbi:hypothetical protein [Corynebacterium callunae]|nr:hypothetical protein [Corynebacterium callunae]MCK2200206.1 hypothetical protein [Corynebacterium callunae]
MGFSNQQRADLQEWLAEPQQGITNTTTVFLDALLALFISLTREEEQ